MFPCVCIHVGISEDTVNLGRVCRLFVCVLIADWLMKCGILVSAALCMHNE